MGDEAEGMEGVAEAALRALRVERAGAVAEVILLGPGKGNAMGPDLFRELPQVFAALDADPAIRAVLLRGAGAHFTYGLDLPAMLGSGELPLTGQTLAAERTQLLGHIERLQAAISSVAACRKPVIAAVSGWCIGGGLDLIAACDMRLASRDAKFSLREARVAIVADLGSLQRLPPIIGQGNTRELALTGKDIDAERAAAIGLVNAVYETPAALLDAARAMANEIAANPPLVVQGVKRVMNETQALSVEDGLRYVALWNSAFLQSRDLEEAVTAFVERRPPRYEGR